MPHHRFNLLTNPSARLGATCLAVSLFAQLITSCGTSGLSPARHDPRIAATVPGEWLASGGPPEAGIVDAWWESFGDRQLNALVREAISHNHDLRAAAGRIQTAGAEARAASGELFPTVSGGFESARRRQVTESGPLVPGGSPLVNHSNSFGVSLNTSWEIDLWGRLRKGASAAQANLEAVEADYAARALSLAGQTAKAWFSLTEARQQLQLAERTSESYRGTARQATDRVEQGVQPPTDQHLAESNLASAEALVEQRREAVRRVSRQLEVLVGRYPSGASKGARTLPAVPAAPPAGLPSDLIRRRPDLIAAERRLAASDKRVGAARAALYPRLSLTASGGRSSSDIDNLLDGTFNIWSIAGNAVQPIFQGGSLRAQVHAADGRRREAAELFAQQALNAYAEVESSLSIDQVLALRETKLREASNAARKAAQIGGNRYDQGVETFLVVLESQRRTLDSESAVISARRARLDNRIDLHLALGGGFKALSR